MLKKWESLIGKSAPLIIGSSIFGPDKMQLQSVSVSNVELSPKGVMRAATCSFRFKEFAEEAAGTKKTNSSGGAPKKTALTVGVKQSYKSEKKTVSIGGGTARREVR